jgi:hypothetical protein
MVVILTEVVLATLSFPEPAEEEPLTMALLLVVEFP